MLITEKINVSVSIAIFDFQATTIDKVSTVNLLAEWITYTSVLHLTQPAIYTDSCSGVYLNDPIGQKTTLIYFTVNDCCFPFLSYQYKLTITVQMMNHNNNTVLLPIYYLVQMDLQLLKSNLHTW